MEEIAQELKREEAASGIRPHAPPPHTRTRAHAPPWDESPRLPIRAFLIWQAASASRRNALERAALQQRDEALAERRRRVLASAREQRLRPTNPNRRLSTPSPFERNPAWSAFFP